MTRRTSDFIVPSIHLIVDEEEIMNSVDGLVGQHIYPWINTLGRGQNGCHFADDSFKCIFLNANVWIWNKNSLKLVPKGPIDNILAWVQIMAWRRTGTKPLSEPMVVKLPTHICVTRPQWVNHVLCRTHRFLECFWSVNTVFIYTSTFSFTSGSNLVGQFNNLIAACLLIILLVDYTWPDVLFS